MYNRWPILSLTSCYSGPDGQENCSVSFEGARRVNEKQWWMECEESGKSVTVYRNWIISVCANGVNSRALCTYIRGCSTFEHALKRTYNRISKALGMSCRTVLDALISNCCVCISYTYVYWHAYSNPFRMRLRATVSILVGERWLN